MSLSNQVLSQKAVNGALLEKVMTANDLAGLTSIEKVGHIKNVCESLGLNPLTRPIQLLKFQGKETMYVTKDATEQLRKNHNVSIVNMENKIINDLYIVTAHAETPDGRKDASTGAVAIKGLSGEALCNALLKAETKAKRRVTLSICGLGLLDESEVDSMQGAKKIDQHAELEQRHRQSLEVITVDVKDSDLDIEFANYMDAIEMADDEKQLKSVFTEIKKINFKAQPELLKKLINAKDKRKEQLIAGSIIDEEEIEAVNSHEDI